MPRTTKDIVLSTGTTRSKELILDWLARQGFEVLTMESTGQRIEYRFGPSRSSRVMLAPHPGSIVALHAKMLGVTVFELDVKPRDGGTSIHGEFYIAGAGVDGRAVSFLGQESDLPEKPGWVGRVPRKKGYLLMEQFITGLEVAARPGA